MTWQDAIVWVIVAVAAVHIIRTQIVPLFAAKAASGDGCGSGCGSCPSNAASQKGRQPEVFGLTVKPATKPVAGGSQR